MKVTSGNPVAKEFRIRLDSQSRRNQHENVVGQARIVRAYKNHDAWDTWSGILVGPEADVLATLRKIGIDYLTLQHDDLAELTDAELQAYIETAGLEDEDYEDLPDKDEFLT
jgi:hypothetical protein